MAEHDQHPASATPVEELEVAAYTIPTSAPESDGTLEWDRTTLVVCHVHAGGREGLGYTYATAAAGVLVRDVLRPQVVGADAMSPPGCWERMRRAARNIARPGLVSYAMAAVDVALWDLKARLLDLPLVSLLGAVRDAIPVYGSGGFTSQTEDELCRQLADWSSQEIGMVKMKVGRDAAADRRRVAAARGAIGRETRLFVDANGAYSRKLALAQAQAFAAADVSWFEEPVSSDDLEGLRLLRDRAPAGMEVAAGEYGTDLFYFRRMLESGAVDVLQADATRCGGITELLRVDALCAARSMQLSSHTAPALHLHAMCAMAAAVHLEYFHDHARIEQMLFEGALRPRHGVLQPDLSRPGLGLELKRSEAAAWAV